jgi:hypothetical protein
VPRGRHPVRDAQAVRAAAAGPSLLTDAGTRHFARRTLASPPPVCLLRTLASPPPVNLLRTLASPPPVCLLRTLASPPPVCLLRTLASPPPVCLLRTLASPPPVCLLRTLASPPPVCLLAAPRVRAAAGGRGRWWGGCVRRRADQRRLGRRQLPQGPQGARLARAQVCSTSTTESATEIISIVQRNTRGVAQSSNRPSGVSPMKPLRRPLMTAVQPPTLVVAAAVPWSSYTEE